jgi:hypothetical protein
LILDAHATLAFAAGSILDVKSGRHIELEQRTTGTRIWAADDATSDPSWPKLTADNIEIDGSRSEVAVALGLTHDVSADVRRYVDAELPSVGRLLILKPATGTGSQSVVCGRHAFELADAATSAIREAWSGRSPGATHLFIAAPNSFIFF